MSNSSIPPEAKRVFNGVIFEVWQWQQKMYDGTFKTFEKLKRADTSDAIAIVGDKILIEIQEQPHKGAPFISLPGGRAEIGEDPQIAAQRELIEETGYVTSQWSLLQMIEPSGLMAWKMYTFIARDCEKKQAPNLDSGEKIETQLISFEDLLDLGENPKFRGRHLVPLLLKAKYDPQAREKFHKLLFGK